jgi:hypothetical protein
MFASDSSSNKNTADLDYQQLQTIVQGVDSPKDVPATAIRHLQLERRTESKRSPRFITMVRRS